MSFTATLAHVLAELLANTGIAVYRPTGTYTAEETTLVVGVMPATPPRVLMLTVYSLADDATQADSLLGVQVRVRSARPYPRDALDLIQAVFDELHGTTHLDLSGVPGASDRANRLRAHVPRPERPVRTRRPIPPYRPSPIKLPGIARYRNGVNIATWWVPLGAAAIALVGVIVGQLIGALVENRQHRREKVQRAFEHWRDKKLEAYTEFLRLANSWANATFGVAYWRSTGNSTYKQNENGDTDFEDLELSTLDRSMSAMSKYRDSVLQSMTANQLVASDAWNATTNLIFHRMTKMDMSILRRDEADPLPHDHVHEAMTAMFASLEELRRAAREELDIRS